MAQSTVETRKNGKLSAIVTAADCLDIGFFDAMATRAQNGQPVKLEKTDDGKYTFSMDLD